MTKLRITLYQGTKFRMKKESGWNESISLQKYILVLVLSRICEQHCVMTEGI